MIAIDAYDEFAYLLRDHLSASKCAEMLRAADEVGWSPALVGRDQKYRPKIRKCDRAMVMDEDMAKKLFEDVKHLLPESLGTPVGVNPLFRYLRYEPGEFFAPHHDGTYVDAEGNESRVTIQMYLNDGYEGGHTVFYKDAWFGDGVEAYRHVPRRGDVMLFEQSILHEGAPVILGTKLCVRTEIMFAKD